MKRNILLLVVLGVSLMLLGCMTPQETTQGGSGGPLAPQAGTYTTTGGWGVVTLEKVGGGFEGTYTDTWGSAPGVLKLRVEDGAWVGTWEEAAINRGGDLYNITVTNGGALVQGLANVTREGGHSSFSDSPFVWTRQ